MRGHRRRRWTSLAPTTPGSEAMGDGQCADHHGLQSGMSVLLREREDEFLPPAHDAGGLHQAAGVFPALELSALPGDGRGAHLASGWNYANPAHIMDEIAALTPIYAGISHDRLERGERLQWPVESKSHPGTSILPLGLFSNSEVQWSVAEKVI